MKKMQKVRTAATIVCRVLCQVSRVSSLINNGFPFPLYTRNTLVGTADHGLPWTKVGPLPGMWKTL